MSAFNKFQESLERTLAPVCTKITSSKTISVLSTSMLKMMPVFIGGALFSLLANFPIPAVTKFLSTIGVKPAIDAFVTTQTTIIPLLLTFIVAYSYSKKEKEDGLTAGLFALLMYFMLIPVTMIGEGRAMTKAYETTYMGSENTFAAMFIGIFIAKLYVWTRKKNIVFKMPDTVPPMVAEPFEPIISGLMIIGLGILANFLLSLTPFGNFFTLINKVVQTPVMNLGASVPAMIIVYTLTNILWFFGIHPSAVMAVYSPVLSTILGANASALAAGQALPYFNEGVIYLTVRMGGTGSTLGLVVVMLLFAKSMRYKEINKLCAIPGLFNINEPLVFGMPIMMNPMFFIPMMLAPTVSIAAGLLSAHLLNPVINTVVQMTTPWTMPAPITGFLAGGIPLLLVVVIVVLADALLWAPFFLAADRAACKEEAAVQEEHSEEAQA